MIDGGSVVAIIIAVIAIVPATLAWLNTRRRDKTLAEVDGDRVVIVGFSELVAHLEKRLKDEGDDCQRKLSQLRDECREKLGEMQAEMDKLRTHIASLDRRDHQEPFVGQDRREA